VPGFQIGWVLAVPQPPDVATHQSSRVGCGILKAYSLNSVSNMWPDNETERDFLNFSGVAETVAEIIVQARGRPISIGISGAWGIGKSSMIKLVQSALATRPRKEGEREFIFVEFNAWLYQGYDDARAALMDVIASKLEAEAEQRKKGLDKAKELLKRVRWLRAAKLVAGSAAAIAFGLPPTGLIGDMWGIGRRAFSEGVDSKLLSDARGKAGEVAEAASGLLKPKEETSPPKEIQALRDTFEETLDELGITLVVLIDDLDRCLPETTISTLEAIRLFLFLKNTAFVIAADNEMIKHAVRRHFEGVPDDLLVTNYFDKLIQVPIRVPPLGTQEVRAYMMLLFVENSRLDEDIKEKIRAGVCAQLRQTWQGKRVDRAFVQTLHDEYPAELVSKFDTADRLAPPMTSATGISGNPRLIKRFLNALSIRMTISNAQGVGVDEAVLAKLLLFERLGNPNAYAALIAAASASDEGKPAFLAEWERKANAGEQVGSANYISETRRPAPSRQSTASGSEAAMASKVVNRNSAIAPACPATASRSAACIVPIRWAAVVTVSARKFFQPNCRSCCLPACAAIYVRSLPSKLVWLVFDPRTRIVPRSISTMKFRRASLAGESANTTSGTTAAWRDFPRCHTLARSVNAPQK
jgi:predicted KAP-like P-loop ATPase